MKAVITGASGHIGNTLIRLLLEDSHEVKAIIHNDVSSLKGLDVEKIKANIMDADSLLPAFKDADVVFHLAAALGSKTDSEKQLFDINVKGTDNVIRACIDSNVKRLVHFSSVRSLDTRDNTGAIDETRPLVEGSSFFAYDRSKADTERSILKAIENGLDAIIINPTGVIGPYDFKTSQLGKVVKSFYKGNIPAMFAGSFDFVDVRDVAKGAILASQNGKKGERYLLSGHGCTLAELAMAVEEATGSTPPRFTIPTWMAHIGATLMQIRQKLTGKEPLYSHNSLEVLTFNPNVSHQKATDTFGYKPTELSQTIIDTVKWLKDEGMV